MRVGVWAFVALLFVACCTVARAQELERAATPSWVEVLPAPSDVSASDGAPIRILDVDRQVRFTADAVYTYTLQRLSIQSAEGLGMASTVSVLWSPPRQTVQVHSVRILRGDQVIDILDGQAFQTLRRETNLEFSMLDGGLTATLQPRDLRVGDVLETAFTIRDDGGVLAPHRELLDSLNVGSVVDRFRLRATWPAALDMRFQGVGRWAEAAPRRSGDDWVLAIEERDLQPRAWPDALPPRLYLDRVAQFTDFADWSSAARSHEPLYARAATLEPDSPLIEEIARIRREHSTRQDQIAAALRLVQREVRYVALAMGEGNYTPASADEVWRSRFGDCKGKTALLLALLRGLGVEADPALVSTQLGDGLDQRSPLISWFDHVIVRVRFDGRVYWLDGTRTDDRDLASIVPPAYDWALLLRSDGGLEPIVVPPATLPSSEITAVFDASDGLDAEGRLEIDIAYRGDAATLIRRQASALPRDQLQTVLMSAFDTDEQIRVISVDSRYDEADHSFHLLMTGMTRLAWVGGSGGRITTVADTALYGPTLPEREGLFAPFADAPYAIGHPTRSVSRIRIVLPNDGRGFRVEGGDRNVESGGYRLERTARIEGAVVDITVALTSLTDEVSAADMAAARTRNENLDDGLIRIRAPADYAATDADRARLNTDGADAEDLVERAARLTAAQDTAGALALLDAAVEAEPDNLQARLARGEARFNADDLPGAQADYDRAVELDPADVAAALGQAQVQLADGRAAEAVVGYAVALRLEPGNLAALWGRAVAYYRLGRLERALEDIRALRTAAPQFEAAASREIDILLRLGRREEVRALADTRLDEAATDSLALETLARLALDGDAPDAALSALDGALGVAPERSDLLSLRARVRVVAGRLEGARSDFATQRALAGADPVALNNLCWAQALAGFDLEQALADCDAATDAAPSAAALDSRGMVLLHLSRDAEARAAYDQALMDSPGQSASLYGRGLARLALGDTAGREDIDRALSLDPDAAEHFRSVLALRPDLAP